jgi:hypothetical protein
MARHDPRVARALGLWTAAWLGVFLLGGLLWLGNVSLQWPVLLVPVVWALVALRPRRDTRRITVEPPDGRAHRTDTVQRPVLRPPDGRDGWR